ncbi:MAG: hypothetical protein HY055_14930 [Magnetospirillum sp.]|nr:hypothetical protein [Magnetospirillum sp.]
MSQSVQRRHLWLALSPHGFGHAAMTAPVIDALRRRCPHLRLTIQTSLPRSFLEERYGSDFEQVEEIPDFGLKMVSATRIDVEASAKSYREFHADWPGLVRREAERLRVAGPDLVLANIPYVTIAAAAEVGIPVVALSSLQWADIYRHYLGHLPEAGRIGAQMAAAYNSAHTFLRVTPAMAMPSIKNVVDIGVVARRGRDRHCELRQHLGLTGAGERLGLIAFGGIDHDFPAELWPVMEGWRWFCTGPIPEGRVDLLPVAAAGMAFSDLLASVDVVVTKPGYGTFTEAALAGIPVLYIKRPDWPESPFLDDWLEKHTRALAVEVDDLLGEGLRLQLRKLFALPNHDVATASGNEEAAIALERLLRDTSIACERS